MKCVVWDLDGTLWDATAIELDAAERSLPELDSQARQTVRELREIGIVNALATRNPPSLASRLWAQPWSDDFVQIEASWADKPAVVRRISADADISLDEVIYVDNDAFERAAVEHALPGVVTMSVAELSASVAGGRWPRTGVTREAASRTALYRAQMKRRAAADDWPGDHEAFLQSCEVVLSVSAASRPDLERVHELVYRTNRYNSTGTRLSRKQVAEWIDGPGYAIIGSLSDRFGDYGMVCVSLAVPGDIWVIEVLAVSCRVAGRGCLPGMLSSLAGMATSAGSPRLEIPVLATERNTPLRAALRSVADATRVEGQHRVIFDFDTERTRDAAPDWLSIKRS